MEKIKQLIEKIRHQNEKYGDTMQPPVSFDEIKILKEQVSKKYNVELSETYTYILSITNGIDNDGTIIYSTSKNLISGYDDRYISGILDANDDWHKNSNFAQYIFYADSEIYLFVQSLEDNLFSYRYRDDFDTIIYSTTDDKEFFEIILKCALGEDVESIYTFQ